MEGNREETDRQTEGPEGVNIREERRDMEGGKHRTRNSIRKIDTHSIMEGIRNRKGLIVDICVYLLSFIA